MGIMSALRTGLGLSKGERCYRCGEAVVLNGVQMPIITATIEGWQPLSGYCKSCQIFVCSDHAVFVKKGEVMYLSGCPECQGELQT